MSRADHLLGGLTLHSKRNQHSSDFGRFEPPEHEPFEQVLCILNRQVLAGEQLRKGILNRHIGREEGRVGPKGIRTEWDNGHGMLLKQKSPPLAGGQSMIVWLIDQSRHRAA
jgi:hypothetical protein